MKVNAIKGGKYYFRRKYFKNGKLVGFIGSLTVISLL